MRNYRTEFPDFDAQEDCEALIAAGFTDDSWHNDICPSFTFAGRVALFVDYRAPELREAGAYVERFTLLGINNVEGYFDTGQHFHELSEAMAAAKALALAELA